jgi:hypothetical protein
LLDTAGGLFQVVGNQLRVARPIDFEATPRLTVRVRATDAGGLSYDQDLVVTVTDAPEVAGFDVQRGQKQRSYVRYLDLAMDSQANAAALLGAGRVRLVKRDLAGNNPAAVALAPGTLSAAGGTLTLNFGPNGLGGNRNSNAADGYYTLEIDLDGDGTFETTRSFYRLIGDTNGDRRVDDADVARIDAVIAANGFAADADVNGDGYVNATDRLLALRHRGRSLAPHLWLDD